jgi:hypothetical protein
MARTIQSPGVEIKEFDRTQRANIPTGTNILVTGFADKGPTDEVVQVTSLGEFESIYGTPTTPAERYFYGTIKPLFSSPANIITYRIPYGTGNGIGFGNTYSALVYPITGADNTTGDPLTAYSVSGNATYILGEPVHVELTTEQYNSILQLNGFDWSEDFGSVDNIKTFTNIGQAGMIILNKGRTTINQKYEGFYIGAVDNTNLNPATDYDGLLKVNTLTKSASSTTDAGYTELPTSRLDFQLSSPSDNSDSTFGQVDGSISEIMENLSNYEIDGRSFDDTLSFGVFKLRQSPFTPDTIKLTNVLSESYVGSIDYHRQQNSQSGGSPVSFFIGTNDVDSPNVDILINPYLSNKDNSTLLNANGLPTSKIRFANNRLNTLATTISTFSAEYLNPDFTGDETAVFTKIINLNEAMESAGSLYPLGGYSSTSLKSKDLGNIPGKLDRLLDSIENVEIFDIDITLDGGLSTIWANSKTLQGNSTGPLEFDDTKSISALSGLRTAKISQNTETGNDYLAYWNDITQRFTNFAEFKRKDHIFISDLPRNIFVEGDNFLTLVDPNKNFSRDTLNPIKSFASRVNSNYVTTYAQWVKTYDNFLGGHVYTPFSGFAAQIMANTDSNFQPWFAPAGFTRGRVTGASDLSLFPTQKQRDQLYKVGVNPVAFFPGEGFTVFGQKTMQKLPSAFDRINVRRLFLNLEKATREATKFFVFEPNTLLTRTRVINTLTPLFENAKNTEGLYDYLIVCDERNNTPDIIDRNELIVDIYLKPVRAAEFILVNFYATKTGTDFSELIS